VELNKEQIKNVDQFNKIIDKIGKGNSALFLVKRGKNTLYIALKIG
ncbi:MAG: hypothetical protein GTN99_05710, partial [Candidatus Dadabacteria bacterium]|nr:hypothetical protein [Candidatus Dadabacteria bacterium]NIT13735.1 hypothetical protein [Candidatus Dadabacteria bacterium]